MISFFSTYYADLLLAIAAFACGLVLDLVWAKYVNFVQYWYGTEFGVWSRDAWIRVFRAQCASPLPEHESRQWAVLASSLRDTQWGRPLIEEREVPARVARSRAVCTAHELQRSVTRCMANVDGTALPVDLPTAVLREAGVVPNVAFEWRIREDGTVLAADISPQAVPTLSTEELDEIERLYQKHKSEDATDVWGSSVEM